jgi:hypothetical protein
VVSQLIIEPDRIVLFNLNLGYNNIYTVAVLAAVNLASSDEPKTCD